MMSNKNRNYVEIENEDDHIYYNINYYNDTNSPILINFQDIRSNSIMENPEEYHMSIIRWTVNTSSIPLFFWKTINDDGKTIDNTYFRVKLTDGITTSEKNVLFIPNSISPINNTGVYFVEDFISWINDALLNAYQNPPSPWIPSFKSPPFMYYDVNSRNIGIVAQREFISSSIAVYFNMNMITYFKNLHVTLNEINDINLNWTTLYARINFYPTKDNYINFTHPLQIGAVQLACIDIQTPINITYTWNSLKSIIFTSSLLPINPEYIQNKQNTINERTFNIISDFEINIDNPTFSSSRTWFQYNADIYRYVDLHGSTPLYKIDISVYWTDYAGNVYPLYLDPNTFLSAKILFDRKKSLK